MTRTPRRLRLAAAAAVLPLALGLTACGGDDKEAADPGTSAAPTDSTATPADDAASATPSEDAEASDSADTPTAGSPITADDLAAITAKSVAAASSFKVSLTGDIMGQQLSAQGVGDVSGGKPALQMTMDMGGSGTAEVRLIDNIYYVRVPGQNGGKFISFDLSDPTGPMSSLGDSLNQFDPASSLKAVQSAFVKGTYVGEEDVEGTSAKHYSIVVDTKKILAAFAGDSAPGLGKLPKTSKSDIWIDDEGHVVKTVSGYGGTTLTGIYSDWGTDVNITAPPKSQVTDLASSMG